MCTCLELKRSYNQVENTHGNESAVWSIHVHHEFSIRKTTSEKKEEDVKGIERGKGSNKVYTARKEKAEESD